VKSVLDQLARLGCLYVSFSGGEPLARKNFFKIARYARKNSFVLRLMSNGTLITRQVARRLARLGFECVDLSIYGANPVTHDRFTRVPGSFGRMMAGIENLRASRVPVRLKMTINRFNVRQLAETRKMARKIGASFLAEPYITPRNNSDLTPLEYRIAPENTRTVAEYFVKTNQKYFCEDQRIGLVCNAARSVMAISPTGEVYPCEGMQISAGNIRKKPLVDIWQKSPILKRIRALKEKHFLECYRCSLRKYCFKCMGLANLEKGSYLKKAEIFCMMARAVREMADSGLPKARGSGDQLTSESQKSEDADAALIHS
jgi:radical SAM protein with 4Fe4S-binding SPASM domain